MESTTFKIEKKLGLVFKNKDILRQALTHSSFAYENLASKLQDNEVLEFLGDSVVGLVLADFLFSRWPNLSEGELSKLKSAAASADSLSRLAKKIRLDKQIFLGKGEEKSGGRKKRTILAGAFEALLGAIYLDQGYETAKKFLFPLLANFFRKVDSQEFLIENYKSALQEYLQKENLPSPVYKTLVAMGPDHEKRFIVEVCSGEVPLAKARGNSKKNAEQKAAQKALSRLHGRKMKALTPEMFMMKK